MIDNSKCICPEGTSGSGTVCSAYHLAIPLKNVPLIAYKTAECLDEYWQDISELGSSQGSSTYYMLHIKIKNLPF